ncbi:hypothetical protein VPNG_02411 [Cytospora leucostoma]|uniref:Uncharacterized protein n=1 Tax=Cytospora leucostoma TaxID=1230097 RepID=A0A423XGT9_9PEZI|nr:hypothetical protein VPNG_02411 [Cytospora leucostoma]
MNANDPGSNAGPNSGQPNTQQDSLLALIHAKALDNLLTGNISYESARSSRQARPTFTKAMIEESMKNPRMKTFIKRHTNANTQEAALRRDMLARKNLGDFYHEFKQGDWVTIVTRTKLHLPTDAQAHSKIRGEGERCPDEGKNKKKLKVYCEACNKLKKKIEKHYEWHRQERAMEHQN